MEIYQRTIRYEKDGDKVRLVPFGDIHGGNRGCAKDRVQQMLKRHGRVKRTYMLDMGDACDCIVTKDTKRYRPSCIDPDFITKEGGPKENWIDLEIDSYVDNIQSYVDTERFLGIVSGNHHDDILKYHSSDPTERIAKALKIPNLGYCFFLTLLFKREGKRHQPFTIYGHHGWGNGSRSYGADVQKYCTDAAKREGANLCLYAHTHRKWAMPLVRIEPRAGKAHEVPILVVNTGGFLKTHSEGTIPSYPERGGLPPIPLGYVEIEITTPTEAEPYFGLKGLV